MGSPITSLDHLRINVAALEASQNDYTQLLGFAPYWRGTLDGAPAALFATANVDLLLTESAGPEGLQGICFCVDSLPRMRRRMQRLGIPLNESASASPQSYALEGQDAVDRIDIADTQGTRGISLAFTDRPRTSPQVPVARDAAITGLDHVVIRSANSESTAFLLAAQLGLDLRMDMSRPEWDARLSFFRCGDLIVEVFQSLSAPGDAAADSFYGLSWRTENADATHGRLTASQFDVSAVRQGRRPGTRVMTIRNRTAGVATLLLDRSDV